MAFETLYHRIAPRLKKMAHYYNGHGRFIDGDDLYVEFTSLDSPITHDGGATLADIIPDRGEPIEGVVNRYLVAEEVRNSGLTLREKDVFSQLSDGYAVREIGQRMGISHVMVLKIKKSLLRKWQERHWRDNDDKFR